MSRQPNPAAAASLQQAYYAEHAALYDAMHLEPDDEHHLALAMLAGLARKIGAKTILDVGSGTGRALQLLERYLPEARIIGIEPVEALREIALGKGIAADRLVAGSGEALPFADDSFDLVIETGVLHHVANPAGVVGEMARVARLGVMISDSNKYGQGSGPIRLLKSIIRKLGLWDLMIRLQTGGRMWKWSAGDGLYYSYSVFDNCRQLQAKFPVQHFCNTSGLAGTDLRSGTAHICLIALAKPSGATGPGTPP